MKIAVLSDAHGNSFAVNLCLDYINTIYKADKIFFLGDMVGYYPDYVGVINALQKINIISLSGNHEAMLLGDISLDKENDKIYGINRNKEQLSANDYSFLKSLRPFYELELNERILFVHGSPYDPLNGYIYPDTSISHFSYLPYDIVFMGHTHYPFIKRVGDKVFVNVGSCALPRDQGDLLSFVTYDTDSKQLEILRKYINPEEVIAFYGRDNLDISIINCLYRKASKEIVGRVIV